MKKLDRRLYKQKGLGERGIQFSCSLVGASMTEISMYLQEMLAKVIQRRGSHTLLTSVNLLRTLVLFPYGLLGMLRSVEVKFVQIFDAGQQIFQGVSSRLYQGLGLGTEHRIRLERHLRH